MKLIVLAITYIPERKSASFLLRDLCEDLVKKGHEVNVITYADWIETKIFCEEINGVKVNRIKIPKDNNNRIKRALIELSLSYRAIKFIRKSSIARPDGIVFYSPSIFFGKAIKFLKQKWSIKSFLIIRDIFPDWAVDIGILKKGIIYSFFKHFEKIMLINSDFIGVESKKDINHCKDISPQSDVFHFYNWSDAFIESSFQKSKIISTDKINLIYGGMLGVAQDMLTFLEDMRANEDVLENFRTIIIGNGEQENEIKHFLQNTTLDIIHLNPMEKKDYLNLVKQCQVGLIVLNKKLRANNYPGKTFDYMKYSIPTLAYLNFPNEFGEMIEENDLGYFVNEKTLSLRSALLEIVNNKSNMIQKGLNSNAILKEKFAVSRASSEIMSKLSNST